MEGKWVSPKIVVRTGRQVAQHSPDHMMPWGTRRDNSRNLRFNQKLYQLYPSPERPLRILDLGCAGGRFVRDCLNDGCLAVGLEGSDYSKRYQRAEWATIPNFLFTCDITSEFEVMFESEDGFERLQFDVITAWEVMEHIGEEDLPKVASNVKRHLKPTGLWVTSISPNDEVIGEVRLHQTVRKKLWWIDTFRELGFEHLEPYVRYFRTQFVRGPQYGAPGSFHLVLSLDSSSAPQVPSEDLMDVLYDYWLGSWPQRIIRLLVVGP